MYLQSIEIDGFKSYARPAVLDNFDREFNAITGLNGSGKSNILDAICFVLGISNLTHVRCQKMDDLVFKQGQAGVTRATVTLTFNNSNKITSPIGYEKEDVIRVSRSVVVNGRPSISINGHTCTMVKVQDMFRSVGLNINNPHFLIMQGRIAKVLNMKPKELLGMVEEAAGTTLYELKKENANKQLSEKLIKIQAIEEAFEKDLNPQVEKLKKDREKYYNHQKLEKKAKLTFERLLAFKYCKDQNQVEDISKEVDNRNNEIMECDNVVLHMEKQLENTNKEVIELRKHFNSGPSEEQNQLKVEFRKVSNELSEMIDKRDRLQESESHILKEIKNVEAQNKKDSSDLENLKKKLDDARSKVGSDADRRLQLEEIIKINREKISNLACGVVDNGEGEKVSLKALVGDLLSKLSLAKTENDKLILEKKSLEDSVGDLENKIKKMGDDNKRLDNDYEKTEQLCQKLKNELEKIPFDRERFSQLSDKKDELDVKYDKAKMIYQNTESRIGYDIHPNDPKNLIDKSKIYGPVGYLIDVDNEKFLSALEVAGGGNFRNIIVEDSDTASSILKAGLPRRVSLLPLKNLKTKVVSLKVLETAKSIGGSSNIWLALDLISYDPKYRIAMEHLFGNVLVCSDADVAKRVCFNKEVNVRCVTLDGDDYNPSGILTGGSSRQASGSILKATLSVKSCKEELNKIANDIKNVYTEYNNLSKYKNKYEELEDQLRFQTFELQKIKQAIESSKLFSTKSQLEKNIRRLNEIEELLCEGEKKIESIEKRYKEAEENERDANGFKEREKNSAMKAIDDAQKELEVSKQKFIKAENIVGNLKHEIETYEVSIKNETERIIEMTEMAKKFNDELKELEEPIINLTNIKNEKENLLNEYINNEREKERVLNDKMAEIDETVNNIEKLKLERKQKELKLEGLKENLNKIKQSICEIEENHPFILNSKEHFGVVGTNFDFTGVTYDILYNENEKATKEFEESSKNVNKKCLQALASFEEQYDKLEERRARTKEDSEKLIEAIEFLEKKKNEALHKACKKVNIDFNNIFSELLPGTEVKLIGVDGDVLNGLEVKIAFNGKWKKSLSELSGGQRSLIALSLILAMLKFSPAPLYILDEVDAALDLSHTQNIGQMIKREFKESQFIIVSLKDGMFSNANILYRTKFVDGSSTVIRMEPGSSTN
ncbi:Structural maintenance of chromosomes protein [Strongyloides ratti]|uniref:Structural maintenance of chromosomes protein n=1 Tax=Strongyloides ratti TaxID=34506 RepID=A0A090L6F2_STRRB|nr:Structural maintenance of chromosomes protein [Strongyloides ratti]CEF65312.1 Structural maintenance of chromosomes protein [Strongyloides ratti]